jgi:starch phosphorylase
VKVETRGEEHEFEVQIWLNDLDPETVRVELYADGVKGAAPIRQEMKLGHELPDTTGGRVYRAAVSSARPAGDYTARLIPHFGGASIPLEETRILWQQ